MSFDVFHASCLDEAKDVNSRLLQLVALAHHGDPHQRIAHKPPNEM
jgi:hypothetical protein